MSKKLTFGLMCLPLCAGCSPVAFFALASNVTSTIVNGAVIGGGLYTLLNLDNITKLIRGVTGGG
jgi:hypothetical protein